MRLIRALFLALPFAAWAALPAQAQSEAAFRDALRDVVRSQGLGGLLQGIAGFGALPGISAANFTIDNRNQPDAEVSRINLSPSHRFDPIPELGDAAPHVEVSLGWMRADQTYRDLLAGTRFAGGAESRIDAVSVVPGAGLAFDVTPELTLTPIALGGFSRVEDTTTFTGSDPGGLDRVTRGFLFNYRVDELLYGAALQADYDRGLEGDINLHADARYNHVWAETIETSDSALEGSGSFGVFTAHVEVDGPAGARAFGRELRWIGFAANSTFTGDAADALGFDWFFELGGGVELVDREVVSGIEGVSLRASAIVGDGVTGWSLGAQLEF